MQNNQFEFVHYSDSLLEEYPDIEWTEQNLLQDEKMVDNKKGYIKAAINSKKNEKASEKEMPVAAQPKIKRKAKAKAAPKKEEKVIITHF